MLPFLAPFANGLPLTDAPQDEAAVWARHFAIGRLGAVAACFCIAPFALALPGLQREAAAVIVAVLASGVFGLLALKRAYRADVAAAAAMAGMALVAVGVTTGLSPAILALVSLALILECLALPQRVSGLVAATVLAVATGIAASLPFAAPAGAPQVMLGALLLPLPAAITLCLQTIALRRSAVENASLAASAERRGRILADASSAAVIIADRTGHIVDVTEQAEALLDCPAADIGGRGFIDRVLIIDRPAVLKAVSDAIAYARASTVEVRLATARGHVAVDLDIRRAEVDADMVAIRINLAAGGLRADRAAMFAALSHEIRTPMNAILGFSELLTNPRLCPKDPAKIAEYAAIIHRQALHSFSVTSALVDLLRVEGATFTEVEPVDLGEMVRAVVHQAGAHGAGARLDVLGDAVSTPLIVDPRALRMLLRAVVDGMATAAGSASRVTCRIDLQGPAPDFAVHAVSGAGPDNSAFMGVVEILANRAATAIGAVATIGRTQDGWHADIRFGRNPIVALRPAPDLTQRAPAQIIPLKKSA